MALLASTWLIGCAGPAYRGAPPHAPFDGERFTNQAPFDPPGPLKILRWQLLDPVGEPWPDRIPARPAQPVAAVTSGARITLIGHASVLIQLDGVNVLADPVWAEHIGPIGPLGPRRFQPPGIRFDDLPPIHAVVISHDHFDHLDLPTLKRLAERHHPRILAGLGTAAFLNEEGIPGGEDLDWWTSTTVGPVTVTMAPAQHWSRRGLGDQQHRLWGSYFVAGTQKSVYFAGDTAWGPHFAQVRERLGAPSLALLPLGAYQPRWFMKSQHIGPDQAVAAHRTLGAGRSVGIHWGTFDLSDEGPFDPVVDLRQALRDQGLPEDAFLARFNGGVVEAP